VEILFQGRKLERACVDPSQRSRTYGSVCAYEFQFAYISPPGDTLLETLEALEIPQSELAKRMNLPVKTINGIIRGTTAITEDMAWQLEQIVRIPQSFDIVSLSKGGYCIFG
jgi:Helix-turn-helix